MHDEEFIQSFVEESKTHIETIEKELLNINFDEIDMEGINGIFRAVHTIKGTSGFFDFKNIVALSHELENMFGEIRSSNLTITNEMVDEFLKSNDCLKLMIDDVMNSEKVDISKLVSKLSTLQNSEKPLESAIEQMEEDELDYFDLDTFLFAEDKKWLIQSEIKQGCSLYLLKRKMYGDIIDNNLNLVELLKEIASMGKVIDLRMDFNTMLALAKEDVDSGNDLDRANDVVLEILFTTVLEKDFLPPLLSYPEEGIVELFVDLAGDTKEKIETPPTVVKKENTIRTLKTFDKSAPLIAVEDVKNNGKQKNKSVIFEENIRVNVTLLNALLNLSGEMVLARNQLFRSMESHRKEVPGIDVIFQNINHITTNLQETIMQTRMQPVSNVFNKFPRIARELSRKLGKDIDLELEGTEVELDKSIIEALSDPLTHLVRNAIDHGMEMPDERELIEKRRLGTIKLKAYHESGYVNIDIVDDGKGIDTSVIRRKAFEKGFISNDDIDGLGEQESLQLLFRPGFSTAETVTDLSGRGVGMDVVKTNIEKLGGKIEIFTILGKGTTFRLLLPLTLAIIPSLIIEAENQKFALPQINVQEIVRIKSNDSSQKIEFINRSEVLRLRGRLLPIVRLSDVLGLQRTYVDPKTSEKTVDKRERIFNHLRIPELVENEGSETGNIIERRGYKLTNIVRILVIKIGARRLGLSVDTILGSEEILVKTLPRHINRCSNYSGVTILGDGKVAMILDPSGIIENSNLRYLDDRLVANSKLQMSEADKMREYQNLLLFKCAGPETLGIDMAMVSRVEEICTKDIENIGDKEFIKFRGEPLRIVRPEKFIAISKTGTTKKDDNKYFVIIPKLVKYPMGILIEKVQDTMQTSIKLASNDSISSKGLIGSTIINEKIVLLLNIYELFELANPKQYKVDIAREMEVPYKILLVEDTPFFQKVEKSYLENAGYHVTLAENGKVALEILKNDVFDIVVSDIVMPEMNGIELVKKIRADNMLSKLPVIALTSLTGNKQLAEGLDAGFDAYEFKLDRSRLLEVLDIIMQKKKVVQ